MEGKTRKTHGYKHPPWTSFLNIEPKYLQISQTRHQPGWSCIPINVVDMMNRRDISRIGKPNSNQWPYPNGTVCQKLSFSFSAIVQTTIFNSSSHFKAGTKSVLLRSSLASATTFVVLSLHDPWRGLLVTRSDGAVMIPRLRWPSTLSSRLTCRHTLSATNTHTHNSHGTPVNLDWRWLKSIICSLQY